MIRVGASVKVGVIATCRVSPACPWPDPKPKPNPKPGLTACYADVSDSQKQRGEGPNQGKVMQPKNQI